MPLRFADAGSRLARFAARPDARPRDAAAAEEAAERRRLVAGRRLADALPDLLVEATRVAATVAAGWHGRRRAGAGEAFWQYRPFVPGEPAALVDWRRSARDDELRVREREWEAAHTVWLAPDLSASMDWGSRLATGTKRDRALVLTLALAELLGRAGERVGLVGRLAARSDRRAAERLAEALARADGAEALPAPAPLGAPCELVVIGDFLDDPAAIEASLVALAAEGARLHLARIVDPAEALPPWTGNIEYRDPETGARFDARRAEALRDAWTRRWAAHGAALADLARRRGWTLLVHATDRPPTEALLALHAALGGLRHGLGREPRGRP